MYKSIVLFCVLCLVVIEARPKWQFLPEVPGHIPVYIRNGDTPLEEINPDLAEAFHAIPAGRSVGKNIEAAPDTPDSQPDNSVPEPDFDIDEHPYEKKVDSENANSDIPKALQRR